MYHTVILLVEKPKSLNFQLKLCDGLGLDFNKIFYICLCTKMVLKFFGGVKCVKNKVEQRGMHNIGTKM